MIKEQRRSKRLNKYWGETKKVWEMVRKYDEGKYELEQECKHVYIHLMIKVQYEQPFKWKIANDVRETFCYTLE